LAGGADVLLTIAVTVDAALTRGTVLNNTATVAGNEADPTVNDRSSTRSVTVNVDPDPFPWQNVVNRFDVNNDGFVVPQDVLLIINELNLSNFSNAVRQLILPPPPPPHPFFDVVPDNFVVPQDVLAIINFLNAQSGGEGEGEHGLDDVGDPSRQHVLSPAVVGARVVAASSTSSPSPVRAHRQAAPAVVAQAGLSSVRGAEYGRRPVPLPAQRVAEWDNELDLVLEEIAADIAEHWAPSDAT
jgi:hypothetical protein